MKATVRLPKRTRYPISVRPHPRTLSAAVGVKRVQIKKILVPIDFSPSSHQAIKFSLPLLKKFGAELHLAHVLAPDLALAGLAGMPIILTETESAHHARAHLKLAGKRWGAEPETANIHVLSGQPFEEICRLARKLGIDLIVIPTRGRTGVKDLLLGSTAERVVRHSPCPVLIFKPQARDHSNGKFLSDKLRFGKILVPLDFSNCSEKGLDYAKALALQFGSKLLLFNSVAIAYHVTNDEYARYDFPHLLEAADRASRKEMKQLVKSGRLEKAEVETSVAIGHAGQEICARAEKSDISFIVTSTHGRTGLKHVLVGSTAEYLVRHARCPVLVVPSHERSSIKPNGAKL